MATEQLHLKQDGFVCVIATLPLPSFSTTPPTYSMELWPQALCTRCSSTASLPRSCSLQGTEVTSEQPDLHWDPKAACSLIKSALTSARSQRRGRPADRERHVIPQVRCSLYHIYETLPFCAEVLYCDSMTVVKAQQTIIWLAEGLVLLVINEACLRAKQNILAYGVLILI